MFFSKKTILNEVIQGAVVWKKGVFEDRKIPIEIINIEIMKPLNMIWGLPSVIVPCFSFPWSWFDPLKVGKKGVHGAGNCMASNPWLKFNSKMPPEKLPESNRKRILFRKHHVLRALAVKLQGCMA